MEDTARKQKHERDLRATQLKIFRNFCFDQHDKECNQKYDKTLPYSFHLKCVAAQAMKYANLVGFTEEETHQVICGAYGHDLIEDARLSYNDIKDGMTVEIAEIVFLCTENKGRNRAARKGKEFYEDLVKNKLAVFVKLCDIKANATFSMLTGSGMFKKYATEWTYIKVYLNEHGKEFSVIFDDLDRLFLEETISK